MADPTKAIWSLFIDIRRYSVLDTAKSFFGNGIIPAAAKGIAAQNTPRAQNNGGKNIAFAKSGQRIFRARGCEAAGRRQKRGNEASVKADGENKKILHGRMIICNRSNARRSSGTRSVDFIVVAASRAESTMRYPCFNWFSLVTVRYASRKMRRVLERTTAVPNFLDVVNPNRLIFIFCGCARRIFSARKSGNT